MDSIFLAVYWILGTSLLGFTISFVFSSWLGLSRRIFLIPYIGLTSAFLYWFFQANEINLLSLIAKNWIWGLSAGVIVGLYLLNNIRSQPASRKSTGGDLLLDVTWLGLVYGAVDALFLNIMPVLAVRMVFPQTGSWLERLGYGILPLLASLLVVLTYHLGYSEFRNRSIFYVLIGNSLITLAYLISNNPLGALISHTVMHIAATIRGPETTIQLPPHTEVKV